MIEMPFQNIKDRDIKKVFNKKVEIKIDVLKGPFGYIPILVILHINQIFI